MKKIFAILILLSSSVFCFSQKADVTLDETMGYTVTETYYTGSATVDRIGTASDSTWGYTIKKMSKSTIRPIIGIKLTRSASGGQVAVVFAQKVLDSQSYSTITTVTWKKTTADTTIFFTPSAATAACYNRITLTGSTSTAKAEVSFLNVKVFE